MTAPLQTGQPFAPAQSAEILTCFYRDGFAFIPGVLSAEECAELRQRADRAFAGHKEVLG